MGHFSSSFGANQNMKWLKTHGKMTLIARQHHSKRFPNQPKSPRKTPWNSLSSPICSLWKGLFFWLSFLTKHKTIRHIFPCLSSYSNCAVDFPFCQFCSLITGNTNHIAGRTKPTERLVHYPQAAFQRRLACQFYSVDCAWWFWNQANINLNPGNRHASHGCWCL